MIYFATELTHLRYAGGSSGLNFHSSDLMSAIVYEKGFQSKSRYSTEMETDNVYCSEQDKMLKIKPDIDMSDLYDLEPNMLESVDGGPGSAGEKADIDTCSAGSGTGQSASRRAHELRAAVVFKDRHLTP